MRKEMVLKKVKPKVEQKGVLKLKWKVKNKST